jgi:hypothetical protein
VFTPPIPPATSLPLSDHACPRNEQLRKFRLIMQRGNHCCFSDARNQLTVVSERGKEASFAKKVVGSRTPTTEALIDRRSRRDTPVQTLILPY